MLARRLVGPSGRSHRPTAVVGLVLLQVACATPTEPDATVARVVVAPDASVLRIGDQVDLTAVASSATGDTLFGRPVRWTSSAVGIAAVSTSGRVRALAPGGATVTATVEGRTGSARITVEGVPVARIALSATSLALRSTEEAVVVATPVSADETPLPDRSIRWTTDEATVAVVAQDGYVRAVRPGRARLTATSDGVSAAVDVTVASFSDFDLIFERVVDGIAGIYAADLDGGGPRRLLPSDVRAGEVAASPDGSRIAFVVVEEAAASGPVQGDLWVSDRGGRELRRLTSAAGLEHQPAWSFDGARIAFRGDPDGAGGDIWVIGADGEGLTNLTPTRGASSSDERDPSWHPDGERIVFTSTTSGNVEIWSMPADHTGAWERFTFTDAIEGKPVWSPDGRLLAFVQGAPASPSDLVVVTDALQDFVRVTLPGAQLDPAWSPDGRMLAFSSGHEGGSAIYALHAYSHDVVRRTVGPHPDRDPAWLRRPGSGG